MVQKLDCAAGRILPPACGSRLGVRSGWDICFYVRYNLIKKVPFKKKNWWAWCRYPSIGHQSKGNRGY